MLPDAASVEAAPFALQAAQQAFLAASEQAAGGVRADRGIRAPATRLTVQDLSGTIRTEQVAVVGVEAVDWCCLLQQPAAAVVARAARPSDDLLAGHARIEAIRALAARLHTESCPERSGRQRDGCGVVAVAWVNAVDVAAAAARVTFLDAGGKPREQRLMVSEQLRGVEAADGTSLLASRPAGEVRYDWSRFLRKQC